MEAGLVPKRGIEINLICISSLRGRGVEVLIATPLRIFSIWRQARAIIRVYKPDVVLDMGGYVSDPGGLATWSLGIPVILHEQNGITGLTNRWLAKIATKAMQTFLGVPPNTEVVGNPVRTDVLALPLLQQRLAGREGPVRVLVVGGSQDTRILDQTMLQVTMKLGDSVIAWHRNSESSRQSTEQAYAEAGRPQHKVMGFTGDMAATYAWADAVVCRSGTLTVGEIVAVGLPALFVPSQHRDRQQYRNALPSEKAGVAKTIEQSQLSVNAVTNTLARRPRETLLTVARYVHVVSIPDVTERVADGMGRAVRA